MSWIDNLVLKRRAQATTVFIVESFDLKRVKEFISACETHFKDHEVYLLDIQAGELLRVSEGHRTVVVPTTDGSPLQSLHQTLQSRPAVAVISYVLVQEQAQILYNQMLSWHQNLYQKDRLNTVVIFTASVDFFPAALRRFLHTITIPASTPEERETILKRVVDDLIAYAKTKGKDLTLELDRSIIDASAGLTLQDVEAVSYESFYTHRTLEVSPYTKRKMEILSGFGIEYVEPTRGFETVAGYQSLKDYVQWRIIRTLKDTAEAQKYGLSIPRGALLIGPPGTGKTYFAKALAKEVGLTMLKLSPADFLRSYVGESEARVRQVTQLIESLAPCLVFIDEFDQMATPRGEVMQTDSGVSRRVTNQLLDWLSDENRRSFIIGATNFARLDKAFVRPGRIDEVLVVLPPDRVARKAILEVHSRVIRQVPLGGDVDFQGIADKTRWWSGAELEKLVVDAAALAFKEKSENVAMKQFEEAMRGFEVNISQREQSFNLLLSEVKQLEQYNRGFLDSQLQEFQKSDEVSEKVSGLFDRDLGRSPDKGVGVA